MKYNIADFDNLTASFSSFESKVQKASVLIGSQSAADYIAREAEIKPIAEPPATPAEIATAKESLSLLESELYDDVSLSALGSQNSSAAPASPSAPSGIKLPAGTSIPCLPALATIAVACFAFARGRRRL